MSAIWIIIIATILAILSKAKSASVLLLFVCLIFSTQLYAVNITLGILSTIAILFMIREANKTIMK